MYNEETQDESVLLMKKNGLGMGRFLEVTETVIANAVVGTEEDGDFWYGDVNLNEDVAKLRNVALSLGKSLKIVSESTQMVIPVN